MTSLFRGDALIICLVKIIGIKMLERGNEIGEKKMRELNNNNNTACLYSIGLLYTSSILLRKHHLGRGR